jgi:hypothetical protein
MKRIVSPERSTPMAAKMAEWRKRRATPRASNVWTWASDGASIDMVLIPRCRRSSTYAATRAAPLIWISGPR